MVLYFNVLCFYLFIYLIKLKEWKGEPHKGVLQKQSAYGTCVASNMWHQFVKLSKPSTAKNRQIK